MPYTTKQRRNDLITYQKELEEMHSKWFAVLSDERSARVHMALRKLRQTVIDEIEFLNDYLSEQGT